MAKIADKKKVKDTYLNSISEFLENAGEDVLRIKDNVISFPIVYPDGEEGFITVTISIPTGSRDGEAFDGYEAANEYKFQLEEKTKKAAAKAEEKAKKIARDEKRRASAEEKKEKRA